MGTTIPHFIPVHELNQKTLKTLAGEMRMAQPSRPGVQARTYLARLAEQRFLEVLCFERWLDRAYPGGGDVIFKLGWEFFCDLAGVTPQVALKAPGRHFGPLTTHPGEMKIAKTGFAATLISIQELGFDCQAHVLFDLVCDEIKDHPEYSSDELTCRMWHDLGWRAHVTRIYADPAVSIRGVERSSFVMPTGVTVEVETVHVQDGEPVIRSVMTTHAEGVRGRFDPRETEFCTMKIGPRPH